ncbi:MULTISPECIES: hypothetical protein [unclassified Streptomyces]|uniref:hypothetical protein n=1 Tax=unclassified Streptomyces TaxID=2593676 RepID=UPI003713CD05
MVEGVAEAGDLVVAVGGHVEAQVLGTGGDQGQAGGDGQLGEEFAQRLVAVAAPHGGDHDPAPPSAVRRPP